MNKKLFCLLGPSGSGKTTLGKFLIEHLGFVEVISHTTRKPREGEINGLTYYFVSDEEFDKIEKIEEVEYAGNRYGFSKQEIDYKLENFNGVFLIADKNGIEQLKKVYGNMVVVIYLWSSPYEIFWRMVKRGDGFHEAQSRVKYAYEERNLIILI